MDQKNLLQNIADANEHYVDEQGNVIFKDEKVKQENAAAKKVLDELSGGFNEKGVLLGVGFEGLSDTIETSMAGLFAEGGLDRLQENAVNYLEIMKGFLQKKNQCIVLDLLISESVVS
jgi:hypothetical protein